MNVKHLFTIDFFFAIAFVLAASILITSCEKNKSDSKFHGTWISTDLVDTLEFTTDKDFYKRIDSIYDHFDYSFTNDSITIRYNGVLYILVQPTTHKYQLYGNQLTIDLRPQCYGFRPQIVTFSKRLL